MSVIESSMVTILVRYGAASEVVRGRVSESVAPRRGAKIVVKTSRGEELGTVLEVLKGTAGNESEAQVGAEVLRMAGDADHERAQSLLNRARQEFGAWQQRIADWNLDLQLIDLEWTLDGDRLILYVLNERGPECTKLALQAAAAGFGIIDVQPISTDGPVRLPTGGGGGCGSGGGGCGCHR